MPLFGLVPEGAGSRVGERRRVEIAVQRLLARIRVVVDLIDTLAGDSVEHGIRPVVTVSQLPVCALKIPDTRQSETSGAQHRVRGPGREVPSREIRDLALVLGTIAAIVGRVAGVLYPAAELDEAAGPRGIGHAVRHRVVAARLTPSAARRRNESFSPL